MNIYQETNGRLCSETAIVAFVKANGEVRVLLGTRAPITLEINQQDNYSMGWRENKCSEASGNIPIMDLMLREPRIFNVDRVIRIEYLGVISTDEQLGNAVDKLISTKEIYDSSIGSFIGESMV